MDKRTEQRIEVNLGITYYLWNPLFWKKLYDGTIENISERGMFISTKTTDFPIDSLLEIFIPIDDRQIEIPARSNTIVWKHCIPEKTCSGIGVFLAEPPRAYMDLVRNFSTQA